MPQLLPLSRAARLVGTARSVLQRHIHEGVLPAFDGFVAVEDLLRLFPDAKLEVADAFERVAQIKEQAFGRRVRERMLPSQEILAERLFEQSRELAEAKSHLQRYHAALMRVQARVQQMGEDGGALGEAMRILDQAIDQELAEVLSSEDAPALAILDDMLHVMSAHVTLHPSRREFLVEGADTLLEAGLKAGLALNYGCSNGNCGLCKARVISGQSRQVRPHDYVLSQAEKQAGYILACCHTALTDLALEALEAAGPGDIPLQQIATRVKSVEPLAEDVMLLHLQTPRTQRLRFLAGQRVTLGTPVAGSAEFPVASCPCEDRNLQFHIRRDPDNGFADHLFAGHVAAGDTVSLYGPFGDFTLRDETASRLVFIACDAGFAPVKSLVEHALALDHAQSIHLYRAASEVPLYLDNLCRSWAGALDTLHYRALGPACPAEAAEQAIAAMSADIGAPALHEFYLAGPQAFVEPIATALQQRGLPADRLTHSTE